MLNTVVELRQTAVLASFWQQVPNRGFFHERWPRERFVEGIHALEQSRFTGAVFLSDGERATGVLAYCLGELLGGQVDGYDGTSAGQLATQANMKHFSSKRMVRSVVQAAAALLGGDVRAQWTDLVPGATPVTRFGEAFSGVVVWTGGEPYLELYVDGQLLEAGSTPQRAAGPVLQLSSETASRKGPALFQGLSDQAGVALPMTDAAPSKPAPTVIATERPSGQDVWTATLQIYEAQLGRGAAGALAKLKAELSAMPPAQLPDEIAVRIGSVLGESAAAEFRRKLKE